MFLQNPAVPQILHRSIGKFQIMKKKMLSIKKIGITVIWVFILFSIAPEHLVLAKQGDWAFSLTTGAYKPSLRTLNRIIENPNTAILQDPNFQLNPNVSFPASVRNIRVPIFNADNAFGFEARRSITPKHAFITTLNIWNGEQKANDIAPQITGSLIDNVLDVPRSTRYDLSIMQLWFGWRYAFYRPTPKTRLFLDIGLFGLSYAQLTIDTLLKVPEETGEGFPVVSSLEANGWGLTSRWGVGGNYAINEWIGLSVRAAYIFGRINSLKVNRFFPSGFSSPPVPEANTDLEPRPQVGDRVTIADVSSVSPVLEVRENEKALRLELDGFEAMFALQFYF